MGNLDWRRARKLDVNGPSFQEQRNDRAADRVIKAGATKDKAAAKSGQRTIPCPTCARLFLSVEARDQHASMTHDNPSWQPKANTKAKLAPICPKCQRPARVTATRFGLRADCCGLHSWDLKPLVSPATHDARKLAHATFDPIWKGGKLSRGEAYRRLALAMEMTSDECHISLMTEADANRAVQAIRSGALRENEERIAA